MGPLEKLALGGSIAVAIMAVWNKIRIRHSENVAERREQDREELERLKAEAIERAKTIRCKTCGKKTYPSAVQGICRDCWVGKVR